MMLLNDVVMIRFFKLDPWLKQIPESRLCGACRKCSRRFSTRKAHKWQGTIFTQMMPHQIARKTDKFKATKVSDAVL